MTDDVSVDALTSEWTIAQRVKGHRHSTDDLMTGWYAVEVVRDAKRILDLGAGIGGVGLLALWRSPAATLVAIEAQDVSFALLERNIADNKLGDRVRAIHGDLREVRLPQTEAKFDLVTGSPPYWDVSEGVLPDDPQKQAARFELRGDITDYARAARAHLAENGRFVFCFPTVQSTRAFAACHANGLVVIRERHVVARAGTDKPPLFSLFAASRAEDAGPFVREEPHLVRDEHGVPTAMHAAVRASFGFSA